MNINLCLYHISLVTWTSAICGLYWHHSLQHFCCSQLAKRWTSHALSFQFGPIIALSLNLNLNCLQNTPVQEQGRCYHLDSILWEVGARRGQRLCGVLRGHLNPCLHLWLSMLLTLSSERTGSPLTLVTHMKGNTFGVIDTKSLSVIRTLGFHFHSLTDSSLCLIKSISHPTIMPFGDQYLGVSWYICC